MAVFDCEEPARMQRKIGQDGPDRVEAVDASDERVLWFEASDGSIEVRIVSSYVRRVGDNHVED